MNENVNLKLSDLSMAEAKQRQINKQLITQNNELKSNNDELLNTIEELKADNENLKLQLTEINVNLGPLENDRAPSEEETKIPRFEIVNIILIKNYNY